MRNSSSNRRQRNRNNNGGNGGNRGNGGNQQRTKVYDSNGPDVRIRGTAHQVAEKYLALAKDATSTGDRVIAESYLQHAEHYQRLISSWGEDVQPQKQSQNQNQKQHQDKQQSQPQNKAQDKPKQQQPQQSQKSNDDLGLPNSILGDAPKANSETRTVEVSS